MTTLLDIAGSIGLKGSNIKRRGSYSLKSETGKGYDCSDCSDCACDCSQGGDCDCTSAECEN